jgi:hypothetical protein
MREENLCFLFLDLLQLVVHTSVQQSTCTAVHCTSNQASNPLCRKYIHVLHYHRHLVELG